MTAPKTTAERQRAYRARQRQDGKTEVRGIYAHPAEHLAIRRAADAVLARQDRPRRARAGPDDPT